MALPHRYAGLRSEVQLWNAPHDPPVEPVQVPVHCIQLELGLLNTVRLPWVHDHRDLDILT